MQTHELIPHPDHPPLEVRSITASVDLSDKNWLRLRWRIEGAGRITVPPLAGNGRADGLWQTTCFELFLKSRELMPGAYEEYNLSPSEAWAVYSFNDYREGMSQTPMLRPPVLSWRGSSGGGLAIFDAGLSFGSLPELPWAYGLSAVIEEEDGIKSYWALAHPAQQPDFHHPDCFTSRIAAPEAP